MGEWMDGWMGGRVGGFVLSLQADVEAPLLFLDLL